MQTRWYSFPLFSGLDLTKAFKLESPLCTQNVAGQIWLTNLDGPEPLGLALPQNNRKSTRLIRPKFIVVQIKMSKRLARTRKRTS